jgi:hypothetical protein
MVHTTQDLKKFEFNSRFRNYQHLWSLKHVINIIMCIRDTGCYNRHAIGTFNTYSWVPTSRSLTDTGGGYHIENLRIAIALSTPFPFDGSTDPPNGPARSQIIHNTFTILTGEGNMP